jgi:hypothetical protein
MATTASFQILSNSPFGYHPFIKCYIVWFTETCIKRIRDISREVQIELYQITSISTSVYKKQVHNSKLTLRRKFLQWIMNWFGVASDGWHAALARVLNFIIPSWSTSVSIVSDYRLDDRGSIPAEAKDFSSSLCAQTGSEAHPASCIMGTVGSFPPGGVTLTTHSI